MVSAIPAAIDPRLFRGYDIRGVVGVELTADLAYLLGRALATQARAANVQRIAVARDGRLSGPELSAALSRGINDSGCDVADLGCVPTPVLYFATHHLDTGAGVMVTASHNPPEYNGFKMVMGRAALTHSAYCDMAECVARREFASGNGLTRAVDVVSAYSERVLASGRLARPLRIVVDGGNGAAGPLAEMLLPQIGCSVSAIYCDVDGRFPNHPPDPSQPENLAALIAAVRCEEADLGIAFDGDGDRLAVVDGAGKIIWPDRLLMLLAREVLSRHAGTEIIFDVKCSRLLADEIRRRGGRPLLWKSGHSLLKAKMAETGAWLGGEFSGHIFLRDGWYGFDDGLYAAVRLLHLLARDARSPQAVFAELPDAVNTAEIRIPVTKSQAEVVIAKLPERLANCGGELTLLDGVRVDFADGWGLLRASNTLPCLTLRFEARDVRRIEEIQGLFKRAVLADAPDLRLPF